MILVLKINSGKKIQNLTLDKFSMRNYIISAVPSFSGPFNSSIEKLQKNILKPHITRIFKLK